MGVQEEKQRELICYDWLSSQKKKKKKAYRIQGGRHSKSIMWFRLREFGHEKYFYRSLVQLV